MLAQTCSQIGADSGDKQHDKQKITFEKCKNVPKQESPKIEVSDQQLVTFKPYNISKDEAVVKIESHLQNVNQRESKDINISSSEASTRKVSKHESEQVTKLVSSNSDQSEYIQFHLH